MGGRSKSERDSDEKCSGECGLGALPAQICCCALVPGMESGFAKREVNKILESFQCSTPPSLPPFRTPGKCLLPCPLIQASNPASSATRISQFLKGAQDILRGNCSVERYL